MRWERETDPVRGVRMARQVELYRAEKGPEAVLRQMALRREELIRQAWWRRRMKAPGQPR